MDVRDSTATTIRGMTVDFNPPCFSQGRVSAVHAASHSFELAVAKGFLPPDLVPYTHWHIRDHYSVE